MSEPSAVEVITDALVMSPLSDMGGTVMSPFNRAAAEVLAALKAAGFVVATRDEIRAMSVQEQAELIGGEVEWGALGWGGGLIRWGMTAKTARRVIATLNRESGDDAPDVKPTARSVGPWREVQP